jgi:hypothetical protein
MRAVSFALFAAVFFALAVGAAEMKWQKYTNGRFGFILTYPAPLIASPEPTNGDGREFHTPDHEFSVTASAHFFLPDSGDSLEARWNEELTTPNVAINYQKKAPTWYVVSGVANDGTEYYHKFYVKRANWVTFRITYPHAKHQKYDPWVEQIEKSFIPFLEGDFDRLD